MCPLYIPQHDTYSADEYPLLVMEELNIQRGDIVYIRPDFNVLDANGKIKDTTRIDQSIPTIEHVLAQGGIPAIVFHAEHKVGDEKIHPSAEAVAEYLQKKLREKNANVTVHFAEDIDALRATFDDGDRLVAGSDVVMLDNIRLLEKGETSKIYAERDAVAQRLYDAIQPKWALTDSFSVAHREHTSNCNMLRYVEDHCRALGDAFRDEMSDLLAIRNMPLQTQLHIYGGAKLGDKIKLIRNILERMKKESEEKEIQMYGGVTTVGALANNFIAAKYPELDLGDSLLNEEDVAEAEKLLEEFEELIHIPVDVRIAPVAIGNGMDFAQIENGTGTKPLPIVNIDAEEDIPGGWAIVDIGPRTEEQIWIKMNQLGDEGRENPSVVWNGPAGVDDYKKAAHGTQAIVNMIDRFTAFGHEAYIGGGDSVKSTKRAAEELCINYKMLQRQVHISTAGGASIAGLGAKILLSDLPGIRYAQRTSPMEDVVID